MKRVLFTELVGVAEIDEAVDTVGDAVSVLEAETEEEGVAEASSPPVVEEMVADSVAGIAPDSVGVAMSAVVPGSSCRGIGCITPAKATFRHRNRARRAHIRWETAMALILYRRRGRTKSRSPSKAFDNDQWIRSSGAKR